MDIAEKLLKIEALIARTVHEGERRAAELARQRLQDAMGATAYTRSLPTREYTVRLSNGWQKRLFVAICQKHGLKTYRYFRQKHTTAMVRTSPEFMDETLWPEYRKYAKILEELASDILNGLIAKIHDVKEEDEVVIAGELPASVEV